MTDITYYYIAQVVGFLGLIVMMYAFQREERSQILHTQTYGSLLFSIHFYLIGGFVGSLLSLTVVARNSVFKHKPDKPWAQSVLWPFFFALLSIIILASAWEGWISLLPVTGMIIASYAMWLDDAHEIKKYIILSSALWMPYSLFHQAYPSLINQILICASAIFATVKNTYYKKAE
ncbi:MAG: hypothetical protein RI911_458 [Candidatus Parcubacteria bacterium]|jgi:hypothetical protein